ncbi:spore germination protein [Falsibacillus albus]|uniref:Spore germination protein n=1 Tax=Falsibacillus albus TaxID=2478915 RepID=A0A3L7JXK0_9BACI|nr:spore germination protein [Falsibacillus albus]RLQ95473.1 spore germination protein [Falsibacillus albus]
MRKHSEKDTGKKVEMVKELLGNPSDLVILHKEISVNDEKMHFDMLRIDGISDSKISIEFMNQLDLSGIASLHDIQQELKEIGIKVTTIKLGSDLSPAISAVLDGNTVVFFCESSEVFILDSSKYEKRDITEPTSQTVIRGPKEAFIESLRSNTSLVRKRVRSEQLRIESFKVGNTSKTNVELMYLADQVDVECLDKLRMRIEKGMADIILETGYIEKMVQDQQQTIFPTVMNTERPDEVVSNILMGKIAIFVDNTPFVLLCPITFFQFFQSPEDYYHNFNMGILIQSLRFISFSLSLVAPALYVGLITHHHAMIPTPLLISLYAQREGIPFPVIIEALLMEFIFEILREAGVRMPRAIGQAVSIVGALVIGQTAVQAGLVSTAVVIVVSMTAISSFTMPNYNLAITARILRFVFMGLSYFIGFYGLLLGLIILFGHLIMITSIGRPYLRSLSNKLST